MGEEKKMLSAQKYLVNYSQLFNITLKNFPRAQYINILFLSQLPEIDRIGRFMLRQRTTDSWLSSLIEEELSVAQSGASHYQTRRNRYG